MKQCQKSATNESDLTLLGKRFVFKRIVCLCLVRKQAWWEPNTIILL